MKRYYCSDVRKVIGFTGECCPSCHEDDDAGLAPMAQSEDGGDLAEFCCEVLRAFPDFATRDTFLWGKLRQVKP